MQSTTEQTFVPHEELPKLPLAAYTLVARSLQHEDLSSLRLVSRAWCYAANRAVRYLNNSGFSMTKAQLDNLHTVVEKFPGLSSVALILPNAEPYLKTLLPLTSLQSISLYWTAASSPAAWRLLQGQACLTSLRVACLEYGGESGVQDSYLQNLTVLQSLKELDLSLSTLATDAGIRTLSQLTQLHSLRLPVSKYDAEFSGSSANVFTALTRLTCLSLIGWPITDVEVIRMTCLSSLRFVDFSECEKLSCLSFMPLLQFPCLNSLSIVRGDEWLIEPIIAMFQLLRPNVKLQL